MRGRPGGACIVGWLDDLALKIRSAPVLLYMKHTVHLRSDLIDENQLDELFNDQSFFPCQDSLEGEKLGMLIMHCCTS